MAFPSTNAAGTPTGSVSPHRPKVAAQRLSSGRTLEGDHQLEKLEFALAVALSRGDHQRCQLLRDQIESLGGNLEEPGT